MSWEFEQVAGPYGFTEGPAWDGEAVLFTDISTSRVMRYDPASGECTAFRSGTNEANGLIFDKDGNLHACEGSKLFSDGEGGRRISRYNADGTTTVVVEDFEGKRLNSPNDLAFDAQGGDKGPELRGRGLAGHYLVQHLSGGRRAAAVIAQLLA